MTKEDTRGALLVGAGKVGALYDIDKGPDADPLTHLSALTTCQQVGWIDVLETNSEHVRRIKRNEKIRYCFASVQEVEANANDYKIACIATPSDTHFSVLRALNKSAINIDHVLCEKPLFSAYAEFHSQVSDIKQMRFPVTVNYPRTWSIDNTGLLDLAATHDLGAYTSGIATYGKGLKNNGSHMINLLVQLFNGVPEITSVGRYCINDLSQDPTVSFGLLFDGQEVAVIATSSKSFSLFELDLRFERGRIVLKDGGRTVECHTPIADPDYPGYKILGHHMTKPTDLGGSMLTAIDSVIASPDSINLEQAIITADTYFRVEAEFNQARSSGINV
jgi:predicted dehydrogenase